jgi:carbonic anhydrase
MDAEKSSCSPPFAQVAIIGCSDSRVPPEIIFDLALGDVFVIRVAGNAYGTGVAGSVHYAVTHLHVKVRDRD